MLFFLNVCKPGSQWLGTATEFSRSLTFSTAALDLHGPASIAASNYLLPALLALWACGAAALAICWLHQWRRVQSLLKSARPVDLRTAWEIHVPVMSAPGLPEPGVVGILRPFLLLPEGIADRLSQAQLDAILAHELCHIRRRDNLMAAIHMAVQAIFWFHPVTWWIGTRLVDERERACDEEVLRRGCQPRVYAESILTVCKTYLSSPLVCVSGVTGSNLKTRIEEIVKNRNLAGLSHPKTLVLGTAAVASVAAPVLLGILNAPAIRAQDSIDWQTKAGGKMAFEVASVKPSKGDFVPPDYPLAAGDEYRRTGGRFRADFPLSVYIEFAYKLWLNEEQRREFSHLPKWVATDRYSIEARAPTGNPTKDQMRLMVQSLLADRFHLAAHFEAREVSVLALELLKTGKTGTRLVSHADSPPCDKPGPDPTDCGSLTLLNRSGTMLAGSRDITMDVLAKSLSVLPLRLRPPVIDKTGLKGTFDFTLEWVPDPIGSAASDSPVPPAPAGPTPVEALRDQLGLKLEPAKASLPILVVDRVERPSEN